jgi:integrase
MSSPTFADLSREWLRIDSAPRHSAEWHEKCEFHLRTCILPKLGQLPVDDVRQQEVARMVNAIAEAGMRVKANHVLVTTRNVFAWAITTGRIGCPNPTRDIKRQRVGKRDRVLSLHEMAAVWHASAGLGEWGTICRLLILTGCRCREIGSLVWAEVNLPARQLELPKARVKNRRAHVVPLSDLALAQLPAPRPGYPNLFGRSIGREFNGWSTGRSLMKRKLLGIEPWCLHDLRRSYVTHCNELSLAPPHIIEAAVNHLGAAKLGVAGVYNRAQWLPERRALAEAWSAELGRIVGA